MDTRRNVHFLMVLFAAVYYIVRIAIFYAVYSGSMDTDVELTGLDEAVVQGSFLAIGVAGLLLLPWLYAKKPWGFWGTAAVSAYTIAFDVWGLEAIAPSAAAGIIPAAVLIVYLVALKKEFLGNR